MCVCVCLDKVLVGIFTLRYSGEADEGDKNKHDEPFGGSIDDLLHAMGGVSARPTSSHPLTVFGKSCRVGGEEEHMFVSLFSLSCLAIFCLGIIGLPSFALISILSTTKSLWRLTGADLFTSDCFQLHPSKSGLMNKHIVKHIVHYRVQTYFIFGCL